jgi:hypothetical protein
MVEIFPVVPSQVENKFAFRNWMLLLYSVCVYKKLCI